jgi:hypothetical protein
MRGLGPVKELPCQSVETACLRARLRKRFRAATIRERVLRLFRNKPLETAAR